MYAHTGFSRAKISVYLKNLMELELVEKVLPGTYAVSYTHLDVYKRQDEKYQQETQDRF